MMLHVNDDATEDIDVDAPCARVRALFQTAQCIILSRHITLPQRWSHNDGRTTMVAQRWSHNDGRYHRQLTMTARERWSLSQEAPESLRVENNDDRVVITG
jgi:hypothetical protein